MNVMEKGDTGPQGPSGANSVSLAIDNEHEDFLYNEVGTLISPANGATSPIHLYDGPTEVTSFTPTISSVSGTTASSTGAYIQNKILYVKGITADTAEVVVAATYNGTTYYAKFTANRVKQDKYNLILRPCSISYNSATYPTAGVSIDASAKRIDLQGNETTVTISTSSTITAGNIYLFWAYVSSGGSIGTPQNLQAVSKTVTKNEASTYAGIYFELRKYTSTTAYRICDYETVEIAKAENGAAGDGYTLVANPNTLVYNPNTSSWVGGSAITITATHNGAAFTDGTLVVYAIDSTGASSYTPATLGTAFSASSNYIRYDAYLSVNSVQVAATSVSIVRYGTNGNTGPAGHVGRFFYYDGTWDDTKDYAFEKTQAPFVKRYCTINGVTKDYFFMLDYAAYPSYQQSDVTRYSQDEDPADSEYRDGKPWSLMSSEQQYYIAKAFFGDYAQFGSFIINGDWMLSTNGRIYGTKDNPSTPDYTYFDPLFINGGTKVAAQSTWISGTSWTNLTVVRMRANKSYKLKLTGRTLNANTTLYVQIYYSSSDYKELTITGTDTQTVGTTDLAPYIPSNSGLFTIRARSSSSTVQCYVNNYQITADFATFTPTYAVDGMTGQVYLNDAHVNGDVMAKGLIASDGTYETMITAGQTIWRSTQFPLASIVIGTDSDGMVFKMTDKNGITIWDISSSGQGRTTTSGGGDWTEVKRKKLSGSTPQYNEFSNITEYDLTTYYMYHGAWTMDSSGHRVFNSGESAKDQKVHTNTTSSAATTNLIPDGYYTDANDGHFIQNVDGTYSIRMWQFTNGVSSAMQLYKFTL